MPEEHRKQLKEIPIVKEETMQENKVILEYDPKDNKYPQVLSDITAKIK